MLKAQFTENFDGPGPYGLTPTGSPGWSIDPTYSTSSPNSYKGEYGIGGTVYLTSNSFSTVGNNFVVLNFKQICKIEFVDTAKIEISIDGGTTWTQVTSANSSYLGAGDFANQYDRFSEISYPADWALGNAIPPTNGWWKNEGFDISQLANNAADVRVRFVLVDFLSNNGLNGNYGWLLDDISVVASPCELIPPTVTPQVGYPIWQNTVYNLGPYDVYIHGEDNSLDPIQPMGELYYSVNGGSYNPVGGTFLVTGDSTWYTQIPPADSVNETICWYTELYDNCGNIGVSDTFCFTTADGSSVPFCDNFEDPTASFGLWDTTNVAGSNWDIGVPSGITPHGGSNVAGVSLSGNYVVFSEAYITSPIWDFSGVTLANLQFWNTFDSEDTYDGTVFQYTTNPTDPSPTWTTIGTTNDPNGVNWYNGTIFGGDSAAWTGNSNWQESTYELGTVAGLPGAITAQFRFRFTSDVTINGAGFFMDDFCIKIPCGDDVGIKALTSPLNGTGIPAGQPTNINVVLKNFGLNPQTGFDVVYQVNSNAPVTTTFAGSLNASAQTAYGLTGIVAPSGAFTVCMWTNLTGDCDLTNDTICVNLVGIPTIPAPYCDDFESGNIGWVANIDPNAANQTDVWELGTPTSGIPASAFSGTNAWDVNLANPYGSNALTYLYTPFIDFSSVSTGEIKFDLFYDAQAGGDGVTLEYSTDGGISWNNVGNDPNCAKNWYNSNILIGGNATDAWSGPNSGWIFPSYKLCCLANVLGNATPVQFRFVFASNGFATLTGGATIDDFCVTGSNGDDVGVASVGNGVTNFPSGSPLALPITISNSSSTNTITSIPISYSTSNGQTGSFIWTGSLPPCSVLGITLPAINIPAGPMDVCAWTTLAGDINLLNDTSCASIFGVPTVTAPYCDDFEGGNLGWVASIDPSTANQTDIWELGTPGQAPNAANSGTNAWDVNLANAYSDDALTWLASPFFDFSSITSGELKFAIYHNTENSWDGVFLQYSTDAGATWNEVPNDPACAKEWYNENIWYNNGTDAWSGLNSGWKYPSYKLCCLNNVLGNTGLVQFRFGFSSDPSVTVQSGNAVIDDFCITGTNGDDVGVSAVNAGGQTNYPTGTSVILSATLTNASAVSTITSIPVSYLTSDGQSGSFVWTGTLPPCSSLDITIPPVTCATGPMQVCVWTDLTSDNNALNDTACTTIYGQPTIAPTYANYYSDDFESGNIGWAPAIDPAALTTSVWEFGTPNFGTTTGAYTPTTAWDVNLNSAVAGDVLTYLYTPYFDLTNAVGATLKFYQNRSLDIFGPQFNIEYCLNNNNTWTELVPAIPTDATNWYNNGNFWDDLNGGWKQSILKNIENATNGGVPPSLIQFRFVLDNGFGTMDGVSIDNFEIFVPIPLSVTPIIVTSTVQNSLLFPGQPVNFSGNIKNNGVITVNNHMAVLTIDGVVASSDFIDYTSIGGLQPDSSMLHAFAANWIAQPGYHNVCVYTYDPNNQTDNYQLDDTICSTVLVFDSVTTNQLPFCTGFESGSQWVTANSDSYAGQDSWQMGLPSKPTLSGAHTGNVAWATDLSGNYANRDSAGLFSSLIRVQEGHCYKLEFWQRYKMEYGADGGAVDYSVDYGNSWNRVDFTGTPNIQLYGFSPNYTYVTALDPNNPTGLGFTGYRNSWFKTEKTLRPDIDAQLIVRWKFASDFSAVDEGWVIDDVCFTDLGVCTPLGVNEFAQNNFGLSQNYPNPSYSATSIDYVIPEFGNVKLTVTDLLGQTIAVLADGNEGAGLHTVSINTNDLAAGMYIYTLNYNGEQITKRMIVTK